MFLYLALTVQSTVDIRISLVSGKSIVISSVILLSSGFVWKVDFGQRQKYSNSQWYSYIECSNIYVAFTVRAAGYKNNQYKNISRYKNGSK